MFGLQDGLELQLENPHGLFHVSACGYQGTNEQVEHILHHNVRRIVRLLVCRLQHSEAGLHLNNARSHCNLTEEITCRPLELRRHIDDICTMTAPMCLAF